MRKVDLVIIAKHLYEDDMYIPMQLSTVLVIIYIVIIVCI